MTLARATAVTGLVACAAVAAGGYVPGACGAVKKRCSTNADCPEGCGLCWCFGLLTSLCHLVATYLVSSANLTPVIRILGGCSLPWTVDRPVEGCGVFIDLHHKQKRSVCQFRVDWEFSRLLGDAGSTPNIGGPSALPPHCEQPYGGDATRGFCSNDTDSGQGAMCWEHPCGKCGGPPIPIEKCVNPPFTACSVPLSKIGTHYNAHSLRMRAWRRCG